MQQETNRLAKMLELKEGDEIEYIGGCGAKLTIGVKYKIMWKPRIRKYQSRQTTVKVRIKNDSGNPTMVSAEYFKF